MNRARIRGLWAVFSGAAIMAPPFVYLWFVDYRGAPFPPWANGLAVAFMTPAAWLAFCGAYAVVMGRDLPKSPLSLRL